ncbi:NCS cytosine-purine permease [Laccaria bicolor S238N-H82]|uniref:Cytosine-purine permease n=1 Tax=Laccaria bicolor (strain S238N-H82 / ATCC MYA-4686) TaxID=486041 RepID=B0DEV8_LACBS|nr:cytosine-purine permease [Laccaria bicolor S238N-H82]XP_001891203.1 NCS cytosine-purine permease [Laccaria bicolor S238N-H82]EDQ98144.1 NCS cytosine-purine permease [Laccaria bicolor S238N-H82]EDR06741.1 cytosine-purine permease [Laccaria bicolor S238N-H82]|eukprot:XP_001882588.1 cytosine-purine permease [Laccaria bicolor S238N-H82]
MFLDEKEDVEKEGGTWQPVTAIASLPSNTSPLYTDRWTRKLLSYGVESRGIQPVPVEERTDTQFSKIFFLWFSWNVNILTFSAGTLGPAIFGLGLRDSCLTILFFNIICCAPPAYLATWGPKLGMRQMVISRYSFGYYGIIIPCILNLVNMCGFSILNCILGGQALASAGNGNLSWTVGIVVIAIISLLVSFCGYEVLNWYEKVSWVPVLITFIIALGVGGKHLSNPPLVEPATAAGVLGFAGTLAGFAITFSSLSSDFTTYYRPDVSGWRIFGYSFAGLLLPIVTLQCLGAAVVIAAPSIPAWEQGYAGGNIGGLLEAIVRPTGGFGKFLAVLLSLSVAGNIAATFYSISLNIQIFIPPLVVVPRYVFSLVATAIVIPISIVGAHRFYDTIINFLGLIGYWASAFIAIIILEHLVIRHNNPAEYDLDDWDAPRRLPSGIAALAAGIASFGLVIPCMSQVWFTGPIAKTTGDIGFEVAFGVSAVLYLPFRLLEIRILGHV